MATSVSSGVLTSNTLLFTGRQLLNGVIVNTDGTNAATVIVYDGLDNTGKVLAKMGVAGATLTNDLLFNRAVRAEVGLYVAISGTGASAIILYGTS